eukprot:1957213-Amphidinium_carterae.1
MSTAQGTEWLKSFLALAFNPCGEDQTSLPVGERRLLGQHRKPKYRAVDVYSKDVLALALRSLDKMFCEVKDALFLPDSSRSATSPVPTQCTSEDEALDDEHMPSAGEQVDGDQSDDESDNLLRSG